MSFVGAILKVEIFWGTQHLLEELLVDGKFFYYLLWICSLNIAKNWKTSRMREFRVWLIQSRQMRVHGINHYGILYF